MIEKSIAFALIAASAFACGKSKQEDQAASKAAETKPVEPGPAAPAAPPAFDGPAEFTQWDLPARAAAWRGAWAGEAMSLGQTAAWSIDDKNVVTYVDKKGEKTLELEIESPCTAKLVEKSAGGSSSTTSVYTLKNGALITGLGDAGSRKGDKAIVCGSGKIFTVDGKACTEWENNFKRWKSQPGECGFKQNDKGAEVFWYKARGMETTLIVDGDVIWSEQLAGNHATKHADLAAAKAAQKL